MADKPKRRSKAVSPRIRKAITDAQLLKKNVMNNKTTAVVTQPEPTPVEDMGSPWMTAGIIIVVVGIAGYVVWKKFFKKAKGK